MTKHSIPGATEAIVTPKPTAIAPPTLYTPHPHHHKQVLLQQLTMLDSMWE